MALRCGKLLDSLRSIPACHGLGIARACVEDHFPEPERFGRITALFSQDGEVSQGQMAVDTLIDATKLVGDNQLYRRTGRGHHPGTYAIIDPQAGAVKARR